MFRINQISSDPRQIQKLVLEDGTQLTLRLYFSINQQSWFIEQLTYQDFELNCLRITNSPNMLHQFRNQIPFGLACFTTNEREPNQQNDFVSAASILYILTAAEITQYAEFLTNG